MTVPTTMRAAAFDEFGGPVVLTLRTVPVPEPAPGEMLIRVKAIGINPVDWKTRAGAGVATHISGFPFIPGWDIAGTEVESGRRVMGMVNFPAGGGGYAEYLAAPAAHLVPIPDSVSLTDAAALPLVGLTAWQALFGAARLVEGQRILITGAIGSVGHVAVQLATAGGATVIGVTREAHRDVAADFGCAETYSYDDLADNTAIGPVDAVFDTVGGDIRAHALRGLKPRGTLVTLLTGDSRAGLEDPRVRKILVQPDATALAQQVSLLVNGTLRISSTTVAGINNLVDAHRDHESGTLRGKVVVLL